MGAGDLLVRIGAIVFLVGAVGTLATVAPLLLGTNRLPTPAYFVSMLMGVGLALALGGLLRSALAQRQRAVEQVERSVEQSVEPPADAATGAGSAVRPAAADSGQAAAEL